MENLYLFTGTQEIFIQNRINRIINGFGKEEYSVTKYDGETTPILQILEDCNTYPFLENYKIIIVRNPIFLSKKEEKGSEYKQLIKYFEKPNDTTVLIIDACNTKILDSNPVYKALQKYALIIDYSDSQEVEIKGWIRRNCDAMEITIYDSAIDLFLEYINSDQVRMVNELEKIMNYVGRGGEITEAVIKEMVSVDLNKEIFDLIKAITSKNLEDINRIYQHICANNKDNMNIIALVANQFKELLTTAKLLKAGYSNNDLAKFYGISSGRAYYLAKDAKAFAISDLEDYCVKLAELDYKIKSGQIDRNIGMELILLQIKR